MRLWMVGEVAKGEKVNVKSLFLYLNNKLLIGLALSIIVPKDKKRVENFTRGFNSEKYLRSKFLLNVNE